MGVGCVSCYGKKDAMQRKSNFTRCRLQVQSRLASEDGLRVTNKNGGKGPEASPPQASLAGTIAMLGTFQAPLKPPPSQG